MATTLEAGPPALRRLQELRAAGESPLLALKTIKNDLTGHASRKVEYIGAGLTLALAEILSDILAGMPATGSTSPEPKPEDEMVFTQIAQITCVIAHEGPSFVQPLLEVDITRGLITCLLLPLTSRTCLAVLKCLIAIAENLPPAESQQWLPHRGPAELLYSKKYISCFGNIIDAAGDTMASQQACDAVLALLCKTVTLERQKRALLESGVLKTLSARLASFVVAEGLVPPSPVSLDLDNSTSAGLPNPAPSFAHMSPVLEALSLLIEGSRHRANVFLSDPAVKAVLPELDDDFSPSDIRRAPWGASYFSGAAIPRLCPHGPFDMLLPFLPVLDSAKSAIQSGFPPLSSVASMPKRWASFLPTSSEPIPLGLNGVSTEDVEESSVIPLLLYVVRTSRGKRRLLAAKLLVDLCCLDLVKKERRASFAALLVPLLTRMLVSDMAQADKSTHLRGSYLCSGLHYTRAVPAVLAALVMDDPRMQKVAVDGDAITALSAGFKTTFDDPAGRKPSLWQPYKATQMGAQRKSPGTRLGPECPSWTMRREMKYREGCLQALAAIAPFEDDYRKEICDQGVLTHVILALEPYRMTEGANQQVEMTGNPVPVVLAACAVVRVLTRSVKALRTKLIEADVTTPIIKLMSSASPELRIAATKVLANLAMDFSPVKESVTDTAVVKKLCEQAHSANARLRLESLWALTQLVLNANKKLKQDVVDELGPSWIKLLIRTDPNDIPAGEVIGLVEREYPPLTVSSGRSSRHNNIRDVVMSDDPDDAPDSVRAAPDNDGEAALASNDGFDTMHTTQDDLEIQAQLLDLIRNLFCGDDASDLVKYVLDEMGQDDFFRIMLDRLRPRTMAGSTRKENYTTAAPSTIVVKVLYIISHVGACESRWRSAIASHYALMKQVLTFCSHSDREIRAQCCWLAINLTYEDDASDRLACKHRAVELQKVGFVPQLRKLESDPDLNVRERAKSAIHLLSNLIEA
ncbi:hypothetical protein A1O1_01723 [Capronia coronata CBS 617.96]|uniref:Uncharacterized protein n=1 Tax=Capronia coronata CBS 617.96 TaxID=1182541 RepID=W9YVQ0_9EURO|nr:uncharacterized protein A1O1_01723 [Capronia coronata CBS 617.96]EXJ93331.1 hypothetical protein A1O1_01723 [Capronia coronata CBS 617.96]